MSDNEIDIIYNIKNKTKINLFGSKFVENNINLCKIMINNKEIKLRPSIDFKKKQSKEILEIKLLGINQITNMSCMLIILLRQFRTILIFI